MDTCKYYVWTRGSGVRFRPIRCWSYMKLKSHENAFSITKGISETNKVKTLCLNSFSSGRCGCNNKLMIFKLMSRIDIWSISCEIALRWMPQDLINKKSTLVQVMAWCRQAAIHYPDQWWPRSMMLDGVTRPYWIYVAFSYVLISFLLNRQLKFQGLTIPWARLPCATRDCLEATQFPVSLCPRASWKWPNCLIFFTHFWRDVQHG